MSYVAPAEHIEIDSYAAPEALPLQAVPAQAPQSILIPLAFLLPVALSGIAWFCGGLAGLSDGAMAIVSVLCLMLLLVELTNYGSRQGVGAIVLYGGVLVWFCHDYLFNWFAHDFNTENPVYPGMTAELIARVTFFHCLFIELMTIGFRVPVMRWADRLIVAVPEPADRRFYLWVVIAFVGFGLTAFFFAVDSFPVAVAKVPFQLWIGPVAYTVGRTGNMNYNWGGYVAQIIQMGEVGGLMGAVYALMIARNWIGKIFGWTVWAYWTSYVLPGERRGELAFMVLPPVALLFIKLHVRAAAQLRRRSIWALVVGGVIGVGIWAAVARETADRNGEASINFFRVAGNSMFSEGLRAWSLIPSQRGYADDTFLGATIIRPIPDSIWALVSGLIPRTLWNDKAGADSFAVWYSSYISGDMRGVESGGVVGTTVSSGAVGYWYFRYGPIGVIEGGLFYGWLLGASERALRRANGRPFKVLFALSFATFMFRSFRDLWWHNMDPVILAGILLWIVIYVFFGASREEEGPLRVAPPWALLEQ